MKIPIPLPPFFMEVPDIPSPMDLLEIPKNMFNIPDVGKGIQEIEGSIQSTALIAGGAGLLALIIMKKM